MSLPEPEQRPFGERPAARPVRPAEPQSTEPSEPASGCCGCSPMVWSIAFGVILGIYLLGLLFG